MIKGTKQISKEEIMLGFEQIKGKGCCNSLIRKETTEEAIIYFIKNKGKRRSEYFGVKNYSGFGDQRSDHSRGYGPTHGSIVFEIDQRDNVEVDDFGIMFLLCVIANPEKDIFKLAGDLAKARKELISSENNLDNLKMVDVNQ